MNPWHRLRKSGPITTKKVSFAIDVHSEVMYSG